MNGLDVRRAVDATVSPLSDITRAAVWQRIERAVDASTPRTRVFSRRALVLSFSAVAVLAIVAAISLRAGTSAPPASSHGTALVVEPGAHVRHMWDSDTLDVRGPADVQLDRHLSVRVLRVNAGTLRVHHAGAPLVVTTPSSTTWVSGPVFAIRVVGQTTEIASGEEAAQALLERTELTLSPPPAPPHPLPPPPPSPVVPPPHRPSAESITPAPEPSTEPETPEPLEPPVDTAAATYTQAEAAMRTGDSARAAELLQQIVDEDPASRLAAAATYDLARLAFDRGDYHRARALVARLLASDADPNLHPAARRLLIKIDRATVEK